MSYMDTKFCKICDEEYNWAAPECPGCAHRRYSEEQQAEIKQLRSKVASLEQLLATAEAFHDVAVKERDYARMVLANHQPHEDPRRTEYVVELEREVERLKTSLDEEKARTGQLAAEVERLCARLGRRYDP